MCWKKKGKKSIGRRRRKGKKEPTLKIQVQKRDEIIWSFLVPFIVQGKKKKKKKKVIGDHMLEKLFSFFCGARGRKGGEGILVQFIKEVNKDDFFILK